MWNIVWLIFAACSVALAVNSAIKPSGKLTITPNVIDLNSNVTFYTVSCQLDFVQDGWNSSSLVIKQRNEEIASKAVNSTTIEARQRLDDFKRDGECSVHSFQCSYGNEILDAKQVHVGRPPAEIEFQQNFRCFLRLGGDLDEKYCEFTPISQCDKSADYHLTVEDEGYDSPCVLKKKNGSYSYSSEYSNNCYFPPDDGVILRLDGNNSIGSMTQRFTVNHDFVKVRDVPKPELLDITSDCVDIRINFSNLKYVYREIESQFNISSKYGYKESSIVNHSYVVNYTIEGLYPFTEYKLGVRHRVISRGPRLFEEEYWSDWNWSSFRTNARKPDRAPKTLPGSYSFRNQRDDRSTLVVYWERLEEYEWNGSGFRYNVSAMTETGQMYYPRDVYESNEVATFEDLKIDHYWILVSCYNDEGSAQNTSIMEVFPPKNDLKPTIKKVESNGIDYTVSWYAPAIKSGISNYTVMYCNQPHSSSCKGSIHFLTVPSTQTTINVSSPTDQLNFAVAANYHNHSSDFSWQQCLVSPTANIGSPQFELCNITDTSFDIRMTTPCSSKSFYELLHVYVLTNGTEIRNEPFEQPKDRVWIEGLNPSTNYTVKVVAKDENGTSYVTSDAVQTASIYTKLQLTYFFSIVILAVSALIMLTARKLNQVRNINVELPPALKTLLGEEEGDDYKMILPSTLESIERTPRLYVDLPSGGYNNLPMIIPEEEEFGEVNEIEPERSLEVTQDSASSDIKEDLTVAACTVPVECPVRSSVPSKVQANGYVLAAQFMTPKERQTPQLPPNLTNGSSSGYVMFK